MPKSKGSTAKRDGRKGRRAKATGRKRTALEVACDGLSDDSELNAALARDWNLERQPPPPTNRPPAFDAIEAFAKTETGAAHLADHPEIKMAMRLCEHFYCVAEDLADPSSIWCTDDALKRVAQEDVQRAWAGRRLPLVGRGSVDEVSRRMAREEVFKRLDRFSGLRADPQMAEHWTGARVADSICSAIAYVFPAAVGMIRANHLAVAVEKWDDKGPGLTGVGKYAALSRAFKGTSLEGTAAALKTAHRKWLSDRKRALPI